MVNFGPLAAEIISLDWGTPGNFNGFRVLAALLHGTLVVGVSQTAALNRGRHPYSAGPPSRWAFAHISSLSESETLSDLLVFITAMKTLCKDSTDVTDHELECSEIWSTVFVSGCMQSDGPIVKNKVSDSS